VRTLARWEQSSTAPLGRPHLLLESVNEEGLEYRKMGPTAPAGLAYDYGKGRIYYLSHGHLLMVLWNPEYIKLQQNAVRWLLHKDS
jgi:type 1 glutamine amidotransferase